MCVCAGAEMYICASLEEIEHCPQATNECVASARVKYNLKPRFMLETNAKTRLPTQTMTGENVTHAWPQTNIHPLLR